MSQIVEPETPEEVGSDDDTGVFEIVDGRLVPWKSQSEKKREREEAYREQVRKWAPAVNAMVGPGPLSREHLADVCRRLKRGELDHLGPPPESWFIVLYIDLLHKKVVGRPTRKFP